MKLKIVILRSWKRSVSLLGACCKTQISNHIKF